MSCDLKCKAMEFLWRIDYIEIDSKMVSIKSTDLSVWAKVNTKTGKVEIMDIQPFDDELNESLVDGWEWMRFRLVPDNAK